MPQQNQHQEKRESADIFCSRNITVLNLSLNKCFPLFLNREDRMTSIRKKLGLADFQVFPKPPRTQSKTLSSSGKLLLGWRLGAYS